MLKPHVWLIRAAAAGPMQISMDDEERWRQWFASYGAFILHYAELAEQADIELLSVGTELGGTTAREQDWRRLIARVRGRYGGRLTYAANWYREFEQVAFWDALDYIGIQAYFPLSDSVEPALDQLVQAWAPHREAIERVRRRFGKPVLFTEIGYCSRPAPAERPWEWPERGPSARASSAELAGQAACYEAFFRAFWERDGFAGAYFWKWYPYPGRRITDADFTPQGKPAEDVLRSWYGRRQLTRPPGSGS